VAQTDRPGPVLRSLQQMFGHGRLAGTGYLSILPVEPGIEHSAGAFVRQEPGLFRSGEHRQACHRGRCNAVASTLGVLGSCSRKYAPQDPFLLKFNHNEFLTYPNKYDQISLPASSRRATWGRSQ